MRKMPTNLSHKEAAFLYWCALDKIENESRDHAVFIFGSEENGGHDSTEMITQKEIRSLVNNLAEEVQWRQDMKMIQKVVCADCGIVCSASMESFGSKLSMHDGIWADCPECGLTGYDEIVVGGPCCGRFCDVPDSPLCTCPPDVKEANKKMGDAE